MKKYHVIIIAAPSDYRKEIIADGWESSSSGYTYFYLVEEDRTRNIIFVCPTSRMIIDKIDKIN
jgi:hypothetical protein